MKLACPARVLIQVPVTLFLILILAGALGKTADNTSSIWAASTHVGDQDRITGYWIQPGHILDIVIILIS